MSKIEAANGRLQILLDPSRETEAAQQHECDTLAEAVEWLRSQGCDPVAQFGTEALLLVDAQAVGQRPLPVDDPAPQPRRTSRPKK